MRTLALGSLLGAYFHQDWDLDSEDEWAVLELFVAREPSLTAHLPGEIDQVLASRPTENDLRALVVDELGGYFLADWDGGTYREWLTEIADRVRSATAAPGS